MGRLFPLPSPFSDRTPTVINLDEAYVDEVLDALGSETARQLLLALYEEPRTMSDLAEVSDTSVQNVDYHLQNFEDAGLVEPIDAVDSDQGRAVTVWAPSHDPIVVTAGSKRQTNRLRDLIKQLVGMVGVLALASLLIEWVAQKFTPRRIASGGPTTPTTPTPTPNPNAAPATARNVTETAQNVTGPAGEVSRSLLAGPIPPGLIFFTGGLFILAFVIGWSWYWQSAG